MFPNWFDDSPGAEEYSRNNPNSKHYDPEYKGDDTGIEDDHESDSRYDREYDDWPDDIEAKMLGVDEEQDESIDDNLGLYDFEYDADCASCLAHREHSIEEHEGHLRREKHV